MKNTQAVTLRFGPAPPAEQPNTVKSPEEEERSLHTKIPVDKRKKERWEAPQYNNMICGE